MSQLIILMSQHTCTQIYVMNIVQSKLFNMIQMGDAHVFIIYII